MVLEGGTGETNSRWFMLRRTGTWGNTAIYLENFSGESSQAKEAGKCQYDLQFQTFPTFQELIREPGMDAAVAFASFLAGTPAYASAGFSSDDWYYVNKASRHSGVPPPGSTFVCKWAMQTQGVISPQKRAGSHKCGLGNITLNVFVMGTSVRSFVQDSESAQTQEQQQGEEGQAQKGRHWKRFDDEYIDAIDYQVVLASGEVACMWRVHGDASMGGEDQLYIDNDIFSLKKGGGWFSDVGPTITTKPGFDPLFGLLVGQLSDQEFSVKTLKGKHRPNFPSAPSECTDH